MCWNEQVIVRQGDKITLYCKGADSLIYERLDPKCAPLKELTTSHLNVSHRTCLSSVLHSIVLKYMYSAIVSFVCLF
jgi:magnesium-transporting ATPase (P-type)